MSLVVTGYHGTNKTVADLILQHGEKRFLMSANDYDWLGKGVYFWQDSPQRALDWAEKRHHDQAAVLVATIQLDSCLDLIDDYWKRRLAEAFDTFKRTSEKHGKSLPTQTTLRHNLDRAIIDHFIRCMARQGVRIRCVRAAFQEGEPIYPGSAIYTLTHIQIAVRDRALISDILAYAP